MNIRQIQKPKHKRHVPRTNEDEFNGKIRQDTSIISL